MKLNYGKYINNEINKWTTLPSMNSISTHTYNSNFNELYIYWTAKLKTYLHEFHLREEKKKETYFEKLAKKSARQLKNIHKGNRDSPN